MAVLKYKTSGGTYTTLTNYSVNSPSVLQVTGTSTTAVMSQNASTNAFGSKATVDFLGEKVTEWTPTTATTQANANTYWKKHSVCVTLTSSTIATTLGTYLPTAVSTLGGSELHIICRNTSSTDVSIAIPATNANVVACNGDVVNIKAGAVGEVNIIASATKLYYRVG